MEHELVEGRRGLIKYLLFHYPIENKETVWVLNYLKDHRALRHCRFMSPASYRKGLTLTDNFQLLFTHEELIVTSADVIFNLLNTMDEPFFFYTTFMDAKVSAFSTYEQLLLQMEAREMPDQLKLEPQLRRQYEEQVRGRIDLALLMNDRHDFDYFSQLLIKLKGES